MRSWAVVMKPDAFKKWLAEAKKGISGPGAGLAVFNNNGCGSCHTFKPAKPRTGRSGPTSTISRARRRRRASRSTQFVRESIVDPNKYLAPGYPPNVMPKTFGTLPKSQLDALVELPGERR